MATDTQSQVSHTPEVYHSTKRWYAIQWDETKATLERMRKHLGVVSCRFEGHVKQPDLCRNLRIDTSLGPKDLALGHWVLADDLGNVLVKTDQQFCSEYQLAKGTTP